MLIRLGLYRFASDDSFFQGVEISCLVVLIVFKIFKIVETFTQLTVAAVTVGLAKLPQLDPVALESRLVWVTFDLEKPILDAEVVLWFFRHSSFDQSWIYVGLPGVQLRHIDVPSAYSLVLCEIIEVRWVKVELILIQMESLVEKRQLSRGLITVVEHVDARSNSDTWQSLVVSPGLEKLVSPLKQRPREVRKVMWVDRDQLLNLLPEVGRSLVVVSEL